jgi:4-amino-4-deoxy-L-arabinose transferase-like glycosyltransferase
MPGLGFWDTAEYQAVAPLLGTAHPTGFPSYVVLGWLASIVLTPFGEAAFRMNLLSAILVATAAGLTVVLVRMLTRSLPMAVAAGLGLATTPLVWHISTHADAHAFHLALVAVLLVILVAWRRAQRAGPGDRWLIVAALVFGISLANHALTLLLAPAVGLYVLAVDPAIWRRWRLLATCALVLAATVVLFYLELPLRAGIFRAPLVYGTPDTWDGFRYVVLAEQFHGNIVDPFGNLGPKFLQFVDLAAAQFGPLLLLLPPAFLVTAWREPRYALLSGAAAAVTCFFAMSYVDADVTRYYLGPVLIAWTWLAILASAAAEVVAAMIGAVGSVARARAIRLAIGLAAAVALLLPSGLALSVRADAVDASDDRGAQRWVDATLSALPPNAVVISWWSYSTPLWYAQLVEHRRPDISIVDDRTRLDRNMGEVSDVIDAELGSRPVYIIRQAAEISTLLQRYKLEAVGDGATSLIQVVARQGAGQ